MLSLKRLVRESSAVYTLSSGSITPGKIATLYHKAFDHSVEDRSTVVQRHVTDFTETLFACAQRTEVLGCLGDFISKQLKDNSAHWKVIRRVH